MNPGRRIVFPATILLGASAVALGFIGYREVDPDLGIGDALYKAIGLLALEYTGPPSPSWELELARFLGALALGLALLSLLAALARERADRLRIRLGASRHHVVVGLGDRGLGLAGALKKEGERVVAIESDESARAKASGRGRRIAVIVGDVRDTDSYVDAAAGRAKHVFIATEDDSTSLQALEACLAAIGEGGPSVHVAVDGQLLWRELHRSALTRRARGGTVEYISLPDRVGARLVEEAAESLAGGQIVVWGSGPKAVRATTHAIRWVLINGESPRVTLAGPSADELRAELEQTEPWAISEVPTEIVAEPGNREPCAAFVVGVPYADALAGASILADGLAQGEIFAEVHSAEGLLALERSGFPTDRVHLVDAEADVLGAELFGGSARELIARAKHADYVAKDLQRGNSREENSSLRPWDQLPESLRDSNRRFAESVGARLTDLGADLEPLTGPPPAADRILNEDTVDKLAQVEHDRWVADLTADGWRHQDGEKDPVRKLHPLLVPWSDLSEEDREKDRDAIRLLPEALARVGYELRIQPTSTGSGAVVVDDSAGRG